MAGKGKEKWFMAGSTAMILSSGGPSTAPLSPPSSTKIFEGGEALTGDALKRARKEFLKGEGLYRPRQKYKDKAERKAAAKLRAKERRDKKRAKLVAAGLGPKPKKKYETVEARKAAAKGRRKDRRAARSNLIAEIAQDRPDLIQKYGIDMSKFKLFGQGLQ